MSEPKSKKNRVTISCQPSALIKEEQKFSIKFCDGDRNLITCFSLNENESFNAQVNYIKDSLDSLLWEYEKVREPSSNDQSFTNGLFDQLLTALEKAK